MRVAIYGAGAMGTVLGAYLEKNGQEVTLIDNYEEHVEKLNKDGAKIVGVDNFTQKVTAVTPKNMSGIYDLVFLLTKQTANPSVLPHLKQFLDEDSIVCTLQNGVPEYSVDEVLGGNRTVGGTVLWGATFVEAGVSEVTQDVTNGDILFDIGEMTPGITERIKKVAEVLEKMGPVEVMEDLMASRWTKLLLNSCMSGMSAATGLVFGDVLEDEDGLKALTYLAEEIIAVAKEKDQSLAPVMGVPIEEFGRTETKEERKQSEKNFIMFYDDKRTAKASMLQDLEKGRKTEVEMINGFVVDASRDTGVDTPLNAKIVELVNKAEQGKGDFTKENISEIVSLIK